MLEVLTETQAEALVSRGVKGDDLLNATDLARDILEVGGAIQETMRGVIKTAQKAGGENALLLSEQFVFLCFKSFYQRKSL